GCRPRRCAKAPARSCGGAGAPPRVVSAMAARCLCCACDAVAGVAAHGLREARAGDDLDGAITLGLLEDRIACPACSPECRAGLEAARRARQRALAARE